MCSLTRSHRPDHTPTELRIHTFDHLTTPRGPSISTTEFLIPQTRPSFTVNRRLPMTALSSLLYLGSTAPTI